MFNFFIKKLNIDGKKLYETVTGLYKKPIRLERFKRYFEINTLNYNVNT